MDAALPIANPVLCNALQKTKALSKGSKLRELCSTAVPGGTLAKTCQSWGLPVAIASNISDVSDVQNINSTITLLDTDEIDDETASVHHADETETETNDDPKD